MIFDVIIAKRLWLAEDSEDSIFLGNKAFLN